MVSTFKNTFDAVQTAVEKTKMVVDGIKVAKDISVSKGLNFLIDLHEKSRMWMKLSVVCCH